MIRTRTSVKHWCWHCGELIEDDKHIVWFSNRSDAIILHTTCAMLVARGLLANVHDVMKGTEGEDNVTDAR